MVVGSSPARGARFAFAERSDTLYFVYVLKNPEGRLYIGFTSNLERRVSQHQEGEGGWMNFLHGTPGATRTHDTRFRKPLLYPPELQGLDPFLKLNRHYGKFFWEA